MQRGDSLTVTLPGQTEPTTGTIRLLLADKALLLLPDTTTAWVPIPRPEKGGMTTTMRPTPPRTAATPGTPQQQAFDVGDAEESELDRIVKNPCCRLSVTISSWLAKKNDYPGTEFVGTVMSSSDKAIKLRTDDGHDMWLPRSQIKAYAQENAVAVKAPEDYGTDDDLPPIPHTRMNAWAHQRRAYHFAFDKPASMLAMGMGTGKSLTASALIYNKGCKLSFIFCPSSVVPVWPKEFGKHIAADIRVVGYGKGIATAKKMKKFNAAIADAQRDGMPLVLVTNYEALRSADFLEWVLNLPLDSLICDEIHKLKSPTGTTSKAMAQVAKGVPFRLGLTGTPMPHSPLDIFGQYRILDPTIFGEYYSRFRSYYAEVFDLGGVPLVKGYRNQEELNAGFRRIAFQVGREVLDLPPATHVMRFAQFSPAEQKVYNSLEEEFYAWLEEGVEVSADNALVRLLRLQQLTSGYCRNDITDKEEQVNTAKQELLSDVLDDLPVHEPVIVFAKYTHDLDTIRAVCAEQGRSYAELSGRKDDLAAWQAGEYDVIGINIRAGEAGIDLTRSHYAIYYSLGFSLGDYDQSLARNHRPGQNDEVTYVHLLVEGTVDEKIYRSLQEHRDIVQSIMTWHITHTRVSALDGYDEDFFAAVA